uniref:TGF-beta family profile domain-containing protein n=1 Tax=Branchiostoma floridae TaxID=7739 RepID=C3ZI59_BRAFL|eukprot:XP_002591790.1 hypothetical protein BRAFLDRAFT_83578 [Branchiostoma floridae]
MSLLSPFLLGVLTGPVSTAHQRIPFIALVLNHHQPVKRTFEYSAPADPLHSLGAESPSTCQKDWQEVWVSYPAQLLLKKDWQEVWVSYPAQLLLKKGVQALQFICGGNIHPSYTSASLASGYIGNLNRKHSQPLTAPCKQCHIQ